MFRSTSCPGGLIVTAVVLLYSVHIRSEIWSNEVSDVLYRQVASNVTLMCGGIRSGSLVEWRLNGSALVPPVDPSSDGSLTLIQAGHANEGNYSCHDASGTLLHFVRLRLGYLPGWLSVSCQMSNHQSARCSWQQSVKTYLPTKYIASYRSGTDKPEPCHQDPLRPNECTISHPTTWLYSHTVNITEVNPLGSKTTQVMMNFHKLLKPDPPEAVNISPVVGHPQRLQVSWNYPSTWYNENGAFPLIFQLRYRPVGSSIWSLLETSRTVVFIMDVLAGHPHLIQVQTKDELNFGQWSDWSPVLEGRPWDDQDYTTEDYPTDSYEIYTSCPDKGCSPVKSPDPPVEDYRSLGVLVSLGLFSGVILSVMLVLIILFWVRQKRQDNVTKQELTSMMKMKPVQI